MSDNGAYRLSINRNAKMEADFSTNFGGPVVTPYSLNTNSWYMLTGVYDGSNINIYVNGVFAASLPTSGNLANPSSTSIGSTSSAPYTNFFNGAIADVQVYDIPLNAQQVSQLYNSGMPISTSIGVPLGGIT